ncbi:MAG TPA: hypothetical protein VGD10_11635 [Allosphingosinicella sp.]|uniref:hypothetical protein n=1 Tax=Allosphingosinicella sp. TaxID=2823234 RepID=UPI002ED87CD4
MLLQIAEAVASTPFAAWAAGSAYAYPVANVLHLLGLVLLLGGIGLIDLRLLGAFPRLPLQTLAEALTPLGIAGIFILVASGSVLFAADAVALAGSGIFRLKLVLIGIALANAVAFRVLYRRLDAAPPTAPSRLMALVSLALWLGVATFGRLIAYA